MLKRWTNSYLILMVTVISIIVTIVGESTAQIISTACLFYMTMCLITLRDFYENPGYFPKKN